MFYCHQTIEILQLDMSLHSRYRGEKLDRSSVPKQKRSRKDAIISTVYDKPDEEEDTILRTAPPTVIKHRTHDAAGGMKFCGGGVFKAGSTSRDSSS